MTDPLSLGLTAASVAVAVVLGWSYWPRPPALDGERWFKLAFATTLRGRVDADGLGADAWEAAVLRYVPYHPAGRLPERKVYLPSSALPGAALPGERDLVSALAGLATLSARWARMYDGDEAARAARLADPSELGPDYDVSRWFPLPRSPSETGWDVLAAWEDGRLLRAIQAAFPSRWIAVGGRARPGVPSWMPALAATLPSLERIRWTGLEETTAELKRCLTGGDRLVLLGEEAGITAVLRALGDEVEARDRVAAVVSLGGIIGGDPAETGALSPAACEDWLGAHFAHHALDTERARLTPYLSVGWLDRAADPPGAGGLPLSAQRFPPVRHDRGVPPAVEPVDLGPLPADPSLPLDLAARALVAVVAGWARSRGG